MYFPKLAYKTAQERQHQESSERRGPKKFGLDRGTKGRASGIWSGEGLGAGNLAMQDSRFSHQFFFGCNPIIIWQPWTEKLFPFQKNIGISLLLEANEDDVTQAVTDLNDAANALRDLTKSTKRKSSASADPKAKSKGKKAKKA